MAGLSSFNKKNNVVTVGYLRVPEDGTERVRVLSEPKEFTYFVEHVSPLNWMKSAVCTYDSPDGCWACEQKTFEWNQRLRVYIPVFHEGEVKIFSQTLGKGSVLHSLVQHKIESGSIAHKEFDIVRSGKGKRTKYTAIPVENGDSVVYNGKYGWDATMLKSVDYSEQAEYYTQG